MSQFKKATERLLDYLDMIPDNYKELTQHHLKVKGGELVSTGLINNEKLSVARMHLSCKGITSNWHTHESSESFILQEGSPYFMEIEGLKDCVEVSYTRTCYVPPNTPHRVAGTLGESWSIIVLIPGSNTFPKGLNDGE